MKRILNVRFITNKSSEVDIECSLYNITGGREIKKWDEVNGVASEELQEAVPASETDAYAKLQMNDLARNPLRGIEDLVEQNDNQLDGVINNMPAETVAEKFKEKDLEK